MDRDLVGLLEQKIETLLVRYQSLQHENQLLREEAQRLLSEREGFKARIDAILMKLEEM